MKPEEVAKKYPELKGILKGLEIDEFYPPQAEAIEKGALEQNFLLASGTASGKTLVALLAAARKMIEGKKVLYLAPLRSLAFEKYEELKGLPFKTAISVGEMDSSDPWLANYDAIVATYEKAESLIRHRPDWLHRIGLVVFDEVHEMGRKALIETLAVKLGWSQLLMLSATVGNVEEIAEWLDVDYVKSNFRPVPLREGVLQGKVILWGDEEESLDSELSDNEGIIDDGLNRERQTLVFTNTRRSAEGTAKRAVEFTEKRLSEEERRALSEVAEKVENALSQPTRQCKKLAGFIRRGSAFHHAGLVNKQRLAIEDAFRDGLLRVLGSTVTLAAGLNLPSRRVVIKTPSWRGKPWPVSLYKQAAGRSGRPGYDEEGESIILHKDPDFAREHFIKGIPEDVRSPLAHEPTMRKEIIGLFASGFVMSRDDVASFMKKTFYTHQYGDSERIVGMGLSIVDKLETWGMLGGEPLKTTKLGQKVAEVYIDPYTAKVWLDEFGPAGPFGYIHLMGMGGETRLPRVRGSESDDLRYSMATRGDELVFRRPDPWDVEFKRYRESFKLALILEDWINERSEDYILNRFGIAPGDLRGYVRDAEWLSYAMEQVLGVTKGSRKDIARLNKRLKHGVRQELVELAELPGIGRVKARRLYREGIGLEKLKDVPVSRLKQLIGAKTASRVRKELQKRQKA